MDVIYVSDKEAVPIDDFYLSDDWLPNVSKDSMRYCRELAESGKLYVAYEVDAVSYVIYRQMDALQVFIDDNDNIVMFCEGAIIENDHVCRWED